MVSGGPVGSPLTWPREWAPRVGRGCPSRPSRAAAAGTAVTGGAAVAARRGVARRTGGAACHRGAPAGVCWRQRPRQQAPWGGEGGGGGVRGLQGQKGGGRCPRVAVPLVAAAAARPAAAPGDGNRPRPLRPHAAPVAVPHGRRLPAVSAGAAAGRGRHWGTPLGSPHPPPPAPAPPPPWLPMRGNAMRLCHVPRRLSLDATGVAGGAAAADAWARAAARLCRFHAAGGPHTRAAEGRRDELACLHCFPAVGATGCRRC